jgi:transcription-repair coupling factor (superfamily II helicase)
VNLNLEAYIPEEYLAGGAERLDLYRRISCQRDPEGVAEIARELEDRFGEPPAPARRLLELSELRALASRRGMVSISREGDRLILKGDERMKGLLDGAGRRVQVMDPRTAAVLLEKPRIPGALRRKEGLTDEEVFRAAREKAISEPRERR